MLFGNSSRNFRTPPDQPPWYGTTEPLGGTDSLASCALGRCLSGLPKSVRGTVPCAPESPLLALADWGVWFRTTPFCNACANRAIYA